MPIPTDTLDTLTVAVRADTQGFAHDVADMRAQLEGPFADSADKAARSLETSLARAIMTGKLGFEDLKAAALHALDAIAASAIKSGIGAILSGGSDGGGAASLGTAFGGLLGLPGRATGGPVSPGQAYMVGERGPELFVPTASGSIATGGGVAAPRTVNVSISVNAPAASAPDMLARSSAQVARAVKAALMSVED